MDNITKQKISEAMKLVYSTGRRIPFDGKNPNPKLPIPTKSSLEKLYTVERKSTWEIGKALNVSQMQVRRWLIAREIPRRTYHENPCPTRGKHLSKDHREKISAKLEKNKNGGKEKTHWNWQGGITPINFKVRASERYKSWRMKVFRRDRFTCVNCGSEKQIEADHIKPFYKFKSLRFKVENGRTLCKKCHKKIGWQLFKDANPNE